MENGNWVTQIHREAATDANNNYRRNIILLKLRIRIKHGNIPNAQKRHIKYDIETLRGNHEELIAI